jgi:cytochrome c oxidase assembly protein subunit 15
VSATGLTVLIFLQIALGAFVAGIDAGLASDTWPLMQGGVVPEGLGELSPWYVNLFENPLTVQFDHRMVGYLVVAWALVQALLISPRGSFAGRARLIALAALVQIGLGIWTVVAQVPLSAALLHQAGAVILFALALAHLHQVVRGRAAAAA